ncbi:hypothetical protein Pmani_026154 [Petrolisthes manimaculis]|uniref:Glycosyl transferase CAP10 domain-containing protein n=1 Tax=Petrolisthes manimaculis TaxID=1843537 RepID=A0AAE1P4P3_9EUCA|nr:hypothetical protein Pmani_026154 [Petrolisthes manimaculis]
MRVDVAVFLILCQQLLGSEEVEPETCSQKSSECNQRHTNKYSEASNKWGPYINKIEEAVSSYKSCEPEKCNCHYPLIKKDLAVFQEGISKQSIQAAQERGTLYQIIDHKLYREKECAFPSRCNGIEHFILKIVDQLPDLEMVVNSRDWPQVNTRFGQKIPVFSFSKTKEFLDITYPAWTFWEGGPAISLYPTGLGRWDQHRKSIQTMAQQWPWHSKIPKAFFRGSRTSSERDSLVYLSREQPDLVDAAYTKNQAYKSEADTLYAPPAAEVSLEEHCKYKYLFNFRGVAASFRYKHLFLCGSLVFHVGDEWIEFFYPKMKPWVHYIPVQPKTSKDEIRELLEFCEANDELVSQVAERGYQFIRDHLRMKEVLCYWRRLLRSYADLLQYDVQRNRQLIEIT